MKRPCATPASRLEVKTQYLAVLKHALVGVNKERTSAAAFKELSLYARDRDGLGLATNYVSCGGASDDACR